jgi:hypothetical protein
MKFFIKNLSPRGIKSDSSHTEGDVQPPKGIIKSPRYSVSLTDALKRDVALGMEISINNEEELNMIKRLRFKTPGSFVNPPISTRVSSRGTSKNKESVEKDGDLKTVIKSLERQLETLRSEKSKRESGSILKLEENEKLIAALSQEIVKKDELCSQLEREKKALTEQKLILENECKDFKMKSSILEIKIGELNVSRISELDEQRRRFENQLHSQQATSDFEKWDLQDKLTELNRIRKESPIIVQSPYDETMVATLQHDLQLEKMKSQELNEVKMLNQTLLGKIASFEDKLKSSTTNQLKDDIEKSENRLDEKVGLIEKTLSDSTQSMLNVIKLFTESQNEFKREKEKFKELRVNAENAKQNEMVQMLTKENLMYKKEIEELKTKMNPPKRVDPKMEIVTDKFQSYLDHVKQNDENTKIVDLTKSGVADDNVVELCFALLNNTNVTQLILVKNSIKGTCMDAVCNLLTKNTHLEELHFEGCPIENVFVKQLIVTLHDNHVLTQCTAGKYETDDDIDNIEHLMDRNFNELEHKK